MHSIKGTNFPNLFASFYGTGRKAWSQLFMKKVTSFAQDKRYVTGFVSDSCFYSEYVFQSKSFFLLLKFHCTTILSNLGNEKPYGFSDKIDPDNVFM